MERLKAQTSEVGGPNATASRSLVTCRVEVGEPLEVFVHGSDGSLRKYYGEIVRGVVGEAGFIAGRKLVPWQEIESWHQRKI